jgi:drug/metabolite transporter (DMT)-like permease
MLGAVSYGLFTALTKKADYDKSLSIMLAFFATFVLTLIMNIAKGSSFSFSAFEIAGFLWNGLTTMAIATTSSMSVK